MGEEIRLDLRHVSQGVNDAELRLQAGGCNRGWAVEVSPPLAPAGVTGAGEAGAVGSVRCAERLAQHPKTKKSQLCFNRKAVPLGWRVQDGTLLLLLKKVF